MPRPTRFALTVVVIVGILAGSVYFLASRRPPLRSEARPIEELFPPPSLPSPPLTTTASVMASAMDLAMDSVGSSPQSSDPSPSAPSFEPVEPERLMVEINAARERAGVPPLSSNPLLDRVASARAIKIGQRGELPSETESVRGTGELQRQLVAAGYRAHGWSESLLVTAGDAAAVVDYFRDQPNFGEAMRAEYSDVGIGSARFRGVPLYVILIAWPERDAFSREVRGLADLTAVRAEMLSAVNQIRRANGRSPLAANTKLDRAAQLHAEDLLANSYYDHRDRRGRGPAERATAAGYAWEAVAENLAAGHVTVGEALDAWMKSRGHRKNLLEPSLTELGLGLAVGPFDHRYRVIWVQVFGRPAIAPRAAAERAEP